MTGTCTLSLSDGEFEQQVLQEQMPVLVDFYTEWCPPCKAAAPVIEQICSDFHDRLKVVKVECEECPQTARAHKIGALPTFVVYRGGQIIAQTTGFGSKKVFLNWLESALAKP